MANTSGIRAGRAFVELGVKDKLTAGLKRAQQQLQAFAAGMRSAGLQLTGIAAAVAAPSAVVAKTFADFEQKMARVKALTGANAQDFDRLTAKARQLGEETVFTAGQAADAMSFFALAGYKVDQILAAIGPTLDMASAGQIGIAESADIAAKIMAGMGIEADHLGEAVDVLTKAMTTANTDLRQLGEAMKYVGPIAKSAGTSFEETVAAVQMLSNAGIQADMAGTTLRGALLSLTDPSKEAADQLKRMGVRVNDSKGNVRTLAEIIDDMNRALTGLGSGQKLAIIGRIFDARQAAGFAELLSQGGDKLREFTQSLHNVKGTASRISAIQLDTLKGDVTILESATEGLQIALGKILGPMLRTITQYVTGLVGAISQWIAKNERLVRTSAIIVAGVGAMGAGLLTLSLSATVAAKALGGLAFITGTATRVIALVGTTVASLLSPIGLTIAAIAALGTAIVVYTGTGADAIAWLSKQFNSMRKQVSDVIDGIANALAAGDIGMAAKVLWLGLKLAWQEGVGALSKVWLEGKRFLLTHFHQMWSGALSAAEFAWHGLKTGWIETTSFLSRTWQRFTSFISLSWETIKNLAIKTWNHIKGLFDESFNVEAANVVADRALVDAEQRIEKERDSALKQIQAERNQKKNKEQQVHEQALRTINENEDTSLAQLNAEAQQRVTATQKQLNEARKQLADALAAARSKRDQKLNGTSEPQPGKPKSPLAGLTDQFAGISDVLGAKMSILGTFNAEAAFGLGSSAQERTAKASEETARNTGKIASGMGKGLAFS